MAIRLASKAISSTLHRRQMGRKVRLLTGNAASQYRTLFHLSPITNAKSILKTGLIPGSRKGLLSGVSSKSKVFGAQLKKDRNRVFFAERSSIKKAFGINKATVFGPEKRSFATFKVRLPKRKFMKRRDLSARVAESMGVKEFVIKRGSSVSPSDLKRVKSFSKPVHTDAAKGVVQNPSLRLHPKQFVHDRKEFARQIRNSRNTLRKSGFNVKGRTLFKGRQDHAAVLEAKQDIMSFRSIMFRDLPKGATERSSVAKSFASIRKKAKQSGFKVQGRFISNDSSLAAKKAWITRRQRYGSSGRKS